MLINNPEALKSWLVVVLEPLCDADSSALARYVLALLKKDKPEKELKRVMIEQLDVFLGEETKPFVERLFSAIGTEEYLSPSALAASADAKLAADMAALTGDAVAEISGALKLEVDTLEAETASNAELQNKLHADAPSSSSSGAQYAADKLQASTTDEPKTKDNQNNNINSSSHKPSSDVNASASSTSVSVAHHNAFKTETSSTTVATAVVVASSSSSSSTTAAGNHVRSASPPTAIRTTAAADKENQPRESRRRRASLRSRSRSPRSRSRSNERLSRRSRSRDRRANEREKSQRQFRNKSPPTFSEGGGAPRHERRRGGGGGLDRRRIGGGGLNLGAAADERSPRFGNNDIGGGGRKRTQRSNSRSRSPSQERGRGGGERSKGSPPRRVGGGNLSPSERHLSLAQHDAVEKRQRCRDFDEKGYCVRGETCPWDHGINPVVFEGINNTALISMSLREYNPDAPDLWARGAGPQQALAGGGIGGAGINPFTGTARPGGMNANGAADYARAAGAGFRGAAPLMPFPFNPAAVATPLQRELIPIPVVDASGGGVAGGHHNAAIVGGDIGAAAALLQPGGKRRYELEDSVAIADGGPPTTVGPPQQSNMKRKLPMNSRLGPRMQSLQQQQSNCSLELRKVPRGLNTIAHLNNHFAKFGKIVNIQISYDGDPEAAIVTFSTHAEANVAYRSTEAVLNNRFIKVFWHSSQSLDNNAEGGNNALGARVDGGGRKNSQYHLNNVPAAMPTPAADSVKTATNCITSSAAPQTSQTNNSPSGAANANAPADGGSQTSSSIVAASHLTQPSLRLKNNVAGGGVNARPAPISAAAAAASTAIIRKNQQEKAKAVVQLANGLRKRKQELLQSYVKQMKSALELVERSDAADPQRAPTLATIKVLQETIDKLGKEIAAEQAEMHAQIQSQQAQLLGPPPPKKTKEQQKRELLDIELELFAQQQEGNDTSAIQRRLEELQRSLGIVPGGGGNAMSGGLSPTSGGNSKLSHRNAQGGASGRGVLPPSTRSTFPDTGSTRVDRRPKAIVVTGFTSEEADFVLGHFKHFGEITKHDVDREIPQLILSYATRINAEQAVVRGKLFKDKRLQISWAPVIAQPTSVGVAAAALAHLKAPTLSDQNQAVANADAAAKLAATATGLDASLVGGGEGDKQHRTSESEAMTTSDTLPELRLEDEEEDEESEDRSWRR